MEPKIPKATARELGLVYVMAIVAFGYFVGTWQDGNTYSRLSLVRAIAVEHRFEIDTTQLSDAFKTQRTADRSFFNGHYYSDKAIGSSVIGAAFWAPAHWALERAHLPTEGRMFTVLAPFLGISVTCALLAPLIFSFVTRLADRTTAALVMTAVVFGTAVFKYSTGYYGHVLAGLFLFAAFLIWFAARRRRELSLTQGFLSCFLLGYMVVTEYPTAVLALVFGFYMLHVMREQGRVRDWRLYGMCAAGFVLALAPLVYYNIRVYGSPFTTGYQHHATAKFAEAHSRGLSGIGPPDPVVLFAITFHPLMGIFWQSPVLLLAVAGWAAMRGGDHRAECWFSLSAMLAYLVLMSGYYEWTGGLAYTPRHVIPILPLFVIPLAFLRRKWITVAWCLVAVSVTQHMIAVAGRPDYVVKLVQRTLDANHHPTRFFVSTIWSVIWPNMRAGMFLKNRGALLIPSGFVSLMPLLAVEAALGLMLWRAGRRSRAA